MKKTITFVGRTFMSGEGVINLSFSSPGSLLDSDIAVISPDLSDYYAAETYKGQPCLSDDASFQLKKAIAHWRSEISAAVTASRTVIAFLYGVEPVYVATGEHQYSGAGKNARRTRLVNLLDPLSIIPVAFGSMSRRHGERIKGSRDLGPLKYYWKEFGAFSKYEIYIDEFVGLNLLETPVGGKVVGGLLQQESKAGKILLLPVLDLAAAIESRLAETKTKAGEGNTSGPAAPRRAKIAREKAETSVLNQLFSSLVNIDAELQATEPEATPAPSWVQEGGFESPEERSLLMELEQIQAKLSKLQNERDDLLDRLQSSRVLKGLLFQKGFQLEAAVIQALGILSYQADNVKNGLSEFDVLFVDPEGRRFLGEAEGRDDKAIGVEKLDQLERNIREDFSQQPEDSGKYAKGVLFGNAFRLTEVSLRGNSFTAKCMNAAERSKTSLIRTPDLFQAAMHVLETNDQQFAKECRNRLADGGGTVVSFPTPAAC